jgi:hypothetical protein
MQMNTLKEMEREFKNAIGDIQKHPEHIKKYDLVGLMQKIEKRSAFCVLTEVEKVCLNKDKFFDESMIKNFR